jgi:hypothetical protein
MGNIMNKDEENQLNSIILRRTIMDLKYTIRRVVGKVPNDHIKFFTDKLDWITKIDEGTNWNESDLEPTHFTELSYKLTSILVVEYLLFQMGISHRLLIDTDDDITSNGDINIAGVDVVVIPVDTNGDINIAVPYHSIINADTSDVIVVDIGVGVCAWGGSALVKNWLLGEGVTWSGWEGMLIRFDPSTLTIGQNDNWCGWEGICGL